MPENETDARRAPYNVTWTTFINVIEKLQPSLLPNRIDGSYLNSMAGGTRVYFTAAMRFFGLIDDASRTTSELRDLISDSEELKTKMAELLKRHYPFTDLAVSNATAGELLEAIKERWGGEGDTARKQMSFYLQGCRWAGLPLSPHWPVGKPGGGSPRTPRKNGAVKLRRPTKSTPLPEVAYESRRNSEHRVVELASGMTLTLTASMPLLSLPAEELSAVLNLIKTFDGLAPSNEALTTD